MTDLIHLAVIAGVMACATIGWSAVGYGGAAFGLVLGLALLVVPWRRLPLRSWAGLYLRRNRRIDLTEPLTVANARSGGGIR